MNCALRRVVASPAAWLHWRTPAAAVASSSGNAAVVAVPAVATLRTAPSGGKPGRRGAGGSGYPIPEGYEIDYKNVEFLSRFVSDETGQILRRDVTGLTAKHQRQVARAIKRARAFGLMPYMYKLEQFKQPSS